MVKMKEYLDGEIINKDRLEYTDAMVAALASDKLLSISLRMNRVELILRSSPSISQTFSIDEFIKFSNEVFKKWHCLLYLLEEEAIE